MPFDAYEQALEFLYGRINYERVQADSYTHSDFKLAQMQRLLELLGEPHRGLPVVHIAGTKGKGSTAAMIASILSTAGYRTGLFTSPHLSAFEERMTVDRAGPSPAEVIELVNALVEPVARLEAAGQAPTYFELTTAMAWLYFRRHGAEIAVLEVGLGGRLDATNLCSPETCVLTTISRDHTHLLGSELSQIAAEKAGIVKPGVPVVSGVLPPDARDVIARICAERAAPLAELGRDFRYAYHPGGDARPGRLDLQAGQAWSDLVVPLTGAHQAHNTALAVVAVEQLQQRGWKVTEADVRQGLAGVSWPARIEVVATRPTVIIDAAHNWASIEALGATLAESFHPRRKVLIFAATKDKDVLGMLRQLLPRFDTIILTTYQNNPRAVPPETLLRLVRQAGATPVHLAPDPASAWKLARRWAGPEDLVCVTGSFFIAAELRELVCDGPPAAAVPEWAPDLTTR